MSRQELDRILRCDLKEIDLNVNKKITSIDQITECLTERSNFINSFQQMLKRQLCNLKGDDLFEQNDQKDTQNDQQNDKQDILDSISFPNLEYTSRSSNIEKLQENTNLVDQKWCQHHQYQNYKQIDSKNNNTKLKNKQKSQQFNILETKIFDLRNFNEGFRQQVCELVRQTRRGVMEQVRQSIGSIIELINNVYMNKLESLIIQNQNLNKINRQLAQQIENMSWKPIFQKISNKQNQRQKEISSQNSLNITKKLKQFCRKQKTFQSFIQKQDRLFSIPTQMSQIAWKSYKYSISQAKNTQEKLENNSVSIQANSDYNLPQFKAMSVRNPPTRQGFGILKHGNEIIYKGIWRNGKFHGKGKLYIQDISYEGDFVDGKFEGQGCLKTHSIQFLGVFKENSANGEGILKIRGQKIIGYWENNKFLKLY